MDDQQLDYLKQRYEYEMWRGSNTLDENLFIWRFFLSGKEFPGWLAHRIQPMQSPGWPPHIKSIWQRPEEATEELLSVDIYECESRIAAHEFLLQLLGQFMSPLVQRRKEIDIGDVAFAGPEDTQILFARADLVISIGNAGSDLVPVTEIARQFDEKLIGRPETKGLRVISEILPPDFVVLQDGVSASLAVEQFSSLESRRWHKLFSQSGEIFRQEGRLIYRSTSAGPHEVTIFSIDPSQNATS
ncbi:MAG TPA: hypothetical protein VFR47_05685 [Anaerolineales bacterium]|nr:hypothetical protein [Anaerolineales bacterium]